jgi:hypothetical protein
LSRYKLAIMDMKTNEYREFKTESYDELAYLIKRYLERIKATTVVVWVK